MKNKISMTLLSCLIGGFAIGGVTIIGITINYPPINEKPPVSGSEPESNLENADDKFYKDALDAMDNQNYEQAINYFISISDNYSKIDDVQKNLLLCLVSYTNDIHQKVDDLVSGSNTDANSYTEAINLINNGLRYIDNLNTTALNDSLKNDYDYVQTLIEIYKSRKDRQPFTALEIYNKNTFRNRPAYIDIKNEIIDDCEREIDNTISEYNSNQNYVEIINYINKLDQEFIDDYQDEKKSAERNLFSKIKKSIDAYIEEKDYLNAKKSVDNYYPYLKNHEKFIELYNKWHNYSDTKLFFKNITDESRIDKGSFSDINGNKFNEVILISKYSTEVSVEFSLDKSYSNISATLFLTDYNYSIHKEITPLTICITDDQGKFLKQYDNLTYKQPVNISANISNVKYLRITISGKNNSSKIGIRDGILS